MKINQRVRHKFSRKLEKGIILGFFDKDEVFFDKNGKKIFAKKGEVKVRFDSMEEDNYGTYDPDELELI